MNKPDLMIKRVENGYIMTDMCGNMYSSDVHKVFFSIQQVLDSVHRYFEPDTRIRNDLDNKALHKWYADMKQNSTRPKEGI